jgi:YVTN family beta-propeller protein
VIDPTTWKVTKKITFEVPGVRPELLQPVGMNFSKDGKLLFVALGPANRVGVIDTATKAVKNYILVGQRPWHGELSADGTKLYVANGLTNDLTVIDVASQKAEKSIPVGRLPWGVAVMCDGGEYIKEPSGLFEIDDAKCKIGQYDFKLDKDFNIALMARD